MCSLHGIEGLLRGGAALGVQVATATRFTNEELGSEREASDLCEGKLTHPPLPGMKLWSSIWDINFGFQI